MPFKCVYKAAERISASSPGKIYISSNSIALKGLKSFAPAKRPGLDAVLSWQTLGLRVQGIRFWPQAPCTPATWRTPGVGQRPTNLALHPLRQQRIACALPFSSFPILRRHFCQLHECAQELPPIKDRHAGP